MVRGLHGSWVRSLKGVDDVERRRDPTRSLIRPDVEDSLFGMLQRPSGMIQHCARGEVVVCVASRASDRVSDLRVFF